MNNPKNQQAEKHICGIDHTAPSINCKPSEENFSQTKKTDEINLDVTKSEEMSEQKQMKIDINWLIHDAINLEVEFEQYKLKPEKAEKKLKQAIKQLILERMEKLRNSEVGYCEEHKGYFPCIHQKMRENSFDDITKVINDVFDGRE